MRPLIGYNYGAKEHARVAKLYQLTLGMSAVIMAAGTVICMAASAPSSACSPPTPRPSPSARPPCASSASALWCRRCPPPLPARWKVWARVRPRWSSPSAGTSSSSCRWRGCSAASSAPPASGTPSGSRKCCRCHRLCGVSEERWPSQSLTRQLPQRESHWRAGQASSGRAKLNLS